MRIAARSGNAKLLSRAATVNEKKPEVSPAPKPAQIARIKEFGALQAALRRELAAIPRKQRRSVRAKTLREEIDQLANEIVALEHLPAATPPPAGEPTRVFTLQLTRSARADGKSGFKWLQNFPAFRGEAVENHLIAMLEPGQPYQLCLNGKEISRSEETGWGSKQRSVLTIYGVATAEMHHRRFIQINVDKGEPVPYALSMPVLAGEPFKVLLDGALMHFKARE